LGVRYIFEIAFNHRKDAVFNPETQTRGENAEARAKSANSGQAGGEENISDKAPIYIAKIGAIILVFCCVEPETKRNLQWMFGSYRLS
jgi:hypothetical protein